LIHFYKRGNRCLMVGARLLSVVGSSRLLCTSSTVTAARSGGGRGRKQVREQRLDPATILNDEDRGVFRVLDIGKTGKRKHVKDLRKDLVAEFKSEVAAPRAATMKPDQDWGNVWPAPRTFHPAVVPLPVRQGVVQTKTLVTPGKWANTELMKIPNFLHLTPPVIKRHCDAIRRFCTPWPRGLELDEDVEKHFPVQTITSDYLNSGSNIRDRRARVVCVKFKLASLSLNKHARDKFIRLLGDRYDAESDEVTLVSDRCPYRGQNIDYIDYLITALYHESWVREDWEEKGDTDMEDFSWDMGRVREAVDRIVGEVDHREAFKEAASVLLNEGENEQSLRKYKDKVEQLLKLPKPILHPEPEVMQDKN